VPKVLRMGTTPEPSSETLHPLLRGLKPAWLAAIGRCSVQSHFTEGSPLFDAGSSATRIYLLQRGIVAVELALQNRIAQVAMLGAGDLLACPCLNKARVWQYGARAFSPVTAQSILLSRLKSSCDADPEFGLEISRRLLCAVTAQLEATRRQVAEVSQVALDSQRLALEHFGLANSGVFPRAA
jgi:CRP/FNR family cyclic AMP-dependent transcriptional regulator